MSAPTEERYVDLEKLTSRLAPELFEPLSWILLLNLDMVPEEEIKANEHLMFSYNLMYQNYDEAKSIAAEFSKKEVKVSKYYKELLKLDPELTKTIEIAQTFFALSRRRIEIAEKLGIKQF
ncbi:MAG: hypothetical protein FK732_12980 [Asgard group archaeon]|nr:hypothetical protein [Asgard group archaeon]